MNQYLRVIYLGIILAFLNACGGESTLPSEENLEERVDLMADEDVIILTESNYIDYASYYHSLETDTMQFAVEEGSMPGKTSKLTGGNGVATFSVEQNGLRLEMKIYDKKSVDIVLYRGEQKIAETEEEFTSFISRTGGEIQ